MVISATQRYKQPTRCRFRGSKKERDRWLRGCNNMTMLQLPNHPPLNDDDNAWLSECCTWTIIFSFWSLRMEMFIKEYMRTQLWAAPANLTSEDSLVVLILSVLSAIEPRNNLVSFRFLKMRRCSECIWRHLLSRPGHLTCDDSLVVLIHSIE